MNQTEGEEKGTSYRGIIIFLIIFAIISITFTTVISNLYIAKNQASEPKYSVISGEKEESGSIGKAEIDTTYVLGLDEFYTTNNLQISKKYFFSGDIVIPSEYDYIKKYEENINYIEIDGLKDEVIENKINEDIKNKAFNILKHNDVNKYNIAETNTYVEGNFSNLLSIKMYSYLYNENQYDDDGIQETIYLNYNLTNGEQIKLEEIFADGVSIKEILNENLYDMYAAEEEWWSYSDYVYNNTGKEYWEYYEDGNLEEDIKKLGLMSEEEWIEWKYRSITEEKVLGALLEMRNNDIRFLISPSYICFEIGNRYNSLWIRIREINDKITIYKKFLTDESIFTDEYQVAKNGMPGLDIGERGRIYFPTENMLLFEYFYNDKELESTIVEPAKEKIDADIEYAKKNTNKFFIADVTVDNEYWAYEKFEIDMKDYLENKDSVLKPIFIQDWTYEIEENVKDLDVNYLIYDYNYADIDDLGYIFDSDVRLLSSEELEKYHVNTLNLAYNEIFARHGHDFVTNSLRKYFGTQIWYKPVAGRTVSLDELSDIEIQNLNLIKAKINEKRT